MITLAYICVEHPGRTNTMASRSIMPHSCKAHVMLMQCSCNAHAKEQDHCTLQNSRNPIRNDAILDSIAGPPYACTLFTILNDTEPVQGLCKSARMVH